MNTRFLLRDYRNSLYVFDKCNSSEDGEMLVRSKGEYKKFE